MCRICVFRLRRKVCRSRVGLTAVEFMGCLAAVAAGIWIGAVYTGINLPQTAGVLIGKAGLPVPEVLAEATEPGVDAERAVAPAHAEGSDVTAESPSEKDGIESLEASIRRAAVAEDASPAAPPEDNSRARLARRGQATLEYWNRLNSVMAEEEIMRQVPDDGLTAGNAVAFLVHRKEAAEFAADSIAAIPSDDVDPQVVDLAGNISQWYRRGISQAEMAIQLMGSDPASRRGSPGKQWQTRERQHQQEVELINRRGDALRGTLIGTYGLDFPDLK